LRPLGETEVRRARLLLIAIVGGLVFLQAAPAWAATPPDREPLSFTDSFTSPAGTLCDFTLVDTVDIEGFVITYFNSEGEPIREFSYVAATVTHTNVDTGATLVERLPESSQTNFVENIGQTVGLQWNLVDENGKKVLVVAGRVQYTLEPFEVLSITPRVEQYFFDYAGVICPLLGGSPA
jgi:hypothetical protein